MIIVICRRREEKKNNPPCPEPTTNMTNKVSLRSGHPSHTSALLCFAPFLRHGQAPSGCSLFLVAIITTRGKMTEVERLHRAVDAKSSIERAPIFREREKERKDARKTSHSSVPFPHKSLNGTHALLCFQHSFFPLDSLFFTSNSSIYLTRLKPSTRFANGAARAR